MANLLFLDPILKWLLFFGSESASSLDVNFSELIFENFQKSNLNVKKKDMIVLLKYVCL